MNASPDAARANSQLKIWWIVWTAILAGLVVIYLFLGRGPVKAAETGDMLVNLLGLVPLFVSIVIRWLVLPRYDDLTRAFPVFIVGLALAESCGVLGIFIGGPFRDDLFVLGVLGVAQFVPLFARRLLEPKGSGFIPNN
jgi:hypothetical protein